MATGSDLDRGNNVVDETTTNATENSELIKCPIFGDKFNSGRFGRFNLNKYFIYNGSVPITGTKVPSTNKVLTCILCHERKKGDGAGNFERHLQKKHQEVSLLPRSLEDNDDLIKRYNLPHRHVEKVSLTSVQQLCFKQFMVDLVAIDSLPLNFIEGTAFRAFIKTFLPHINLQCRRTLTRDLKDVVSEEITPKLKKTLDNASFIHLTLDLWSTRSREAVLGVKCHFINEQFKLINRTIAFTLFKETHTGENILAKLVEILNNLGVKSTQIVTVCADNASNMVKAFNLQALYAEPWEVEDSGDESDNQLDDAWNDQSWMMVTATVTEAKWTRLSCVAHTLQLVVVNNLKRDHVAKTVCDYVIMFFRRSTKWTTKLRTRTNGLDLVCPVKTRWNSLCFAMDRFLMPGMKTALTKVIKEAIDERDKSLLERGITVAPSATVFAKIKDLQSLLAPLRDATDCLQSDGPQSSLVVMKLLETFETIHDNNSTKFDGLRDKLLKDLESRFSSHLSEPFYIIPAMLDPRQKCFVFQDEFSSPPWAEIYPEFRTPPIKDALETLTNYATEFFVPQEANETAELTPTTSNGFGLMRKKRPRLEPGSLNEMIHSYVNEETTNTELSCPLAYWKEKVIKYPALGELAKRHLSTPATSASCERLFSKGGSLKRARRSRLGIDLVEDCLMYKEYREPQLQNVVESG